MNPFVLLDPSTSVPPLPDANDPQVTVWRPQSGPIGSLSHIVKGEYWVHALGVAAYKLEPSTSTVAVLPCPGVSRDIIQDIYERSIWPALLQLQGLEVLHASAVADKDGVVAFCAPAQSGKSTITYGLAKCGYEHWADDAVVTELKADSVVVHPLPFQARLRPGTASYFGYEGEQLVRGKVIRDNNLTGDPLALKAICLLRRQDTLSGGALLEVAELSGAARLPQLLEHAQFFGLQDEVRKRDMITNYLKMVSVVPVLELSIKSGFELFAPILDALKTCVLPQPHAFKERRRFYRD